MTLGAYPEISLKEARELREVNRPGAVQGRQ